MISGNRAGVFSQCTKRVAHQHLHLQPTFLGQALQVLQADYSLTKALPTSYSLSGEFFPTNAYEPFPAIYSLHNSLQANYSVKKALPFSLSEEFVPTAFYRSSPTIYSFLKALPATTYSLYKVFESAYSI